MNQILDSLEDENNSRRIDGSVNRKREGRILALQRRLFQIYFELMKERNVDLVFATSLMVIHYIQIYGFLFNQTNTFPFTDDFYGTICGWTEMVRIYPYIQSEGIALYYYVLAFVLIVVLIMYVLLLFYVDYSIRIEKFYFMVPVKFLRYCNSFFFWILSMPITEMFVSIFSCAQVQGQAPTDNNTYHIIDNNLQCWSGIHLFYCAIFMIALLGYIVIFVMISFFYNESRPYHTDAFTRLDNNLEIYITLYKLLITVIGHFLYDPKYNWLIIAIHILGALYFCKLYVQYLPYYNSKSSVIFGAGWFIYVWISLNFLIAQALINSNLQGQSEVVMIGVVLLIPVVHQIREIKIQTKIFKKKHDKIKSEYELDLFIYKLYRLIIDQHVNEVDEMILLGIVHNHQTECLNNDCPLNNTEELYLPLTDSASDRRTVFSKDPILLYHLINSIYAEYAKNSTSTAVLHTTYAYFLFHQIGNIHTAILELNVAEKCDTTYQQKFTIYRAKRFIEHYLVSRFGKGGSSQQVSQNGSRTFSDLDVTIVITFETLFAKLSRDIEKSAMDHIEFWGHLDSQVVDLNVLHKLGLNIITNTKKINDIWAMLVRINPNYPKAMMTYGNYLLSIKNDIVEGEEFIDKANAIGRPKSQAGDGDAHQGGAQLENDFEMMFADNTAIVVISGSKETQAKIIKTNNGITNLFGYNTFEVHGHEVNILMPPIIGLKHNFFLDQYFKTGREKIMNQEVSTFAMLRAGHIFPVSIIVKPVPSLKNDIQYIGLIKPTGKDHDYILTDQYGKIDSISKGFTSMFQLQPTFFKENEIYIQMLCPQLCEIERVKGSKEVSIKFDLWKGTKELTFLLPRNFSSLNQKNGGRNLMMGGRNNDDEENANRAAQKSDAFVGLKSPDHLKKISNMFRSCEHKSQPSKYMQTLKQNINYDNPEIAKGPIKTEIINQNHGNGFLHLKVFKIFNPKKSGGGQGNSGDSDSARGVQNNQGNKNVRALIEETTKRIGDFTTEEIHKKLTQMRHALNSVKKGIRHPSAKVKPSNIITASHLEAAEIQRYTADIKKIETRYKEMKGKEEADDKGNSSEIQAQQNKDFFLLDQSNIDYEQIKNQYPIGKDEQSYSKIPRSRVSAIDISAYGDDSMIGKSGQIDPTADGFFEGIDQEDDDQPKTHFQEEEEKMDLLKDIRINKKPAKPKKKDDGGSPNDTDGQAEGAEAAAGQEDDGEDKKFLEEDTGSVATSTKSLAKHLRMLRNALYENYVPASINNLKINARIVFLMLLILSIVWYFYSNSVYSQLKDNVQNIHSSENRMNSLTNIGADVRALWAMNNNLINNPRGGIDYQALKFGNLLNDAQTIQQAQNNLSSSYLTNVFTAVDNQIINPGSIQLIYNSPAELPMFYYVDVWSAVMVSSVHALSIMELPLGSILRNDTAIFFILTNAMNNILASIQGSTQAVIQESTNISNIVFKTQLYILLAASVSLLISLCLILPVATSVDQNKDELLRNFMLIDREDVKTELDKCKIFSNSMQDKDHMTLQNAEYDEDFKEAEEGQPKEGEGLDGQGHKKHKGRSRKNKVHKKYSTNFISLIIKFLLVLTVLEGYFILCYLLAGQFLSITKGLIQETGTITVRQFSNNFLYQVMQEVLTTNGTSEVMNENSLTYIFQYLNTTIQQQEEFLQEHSNNQAYHSPTYDAFFTQLVYNDVCDAIYDPTTQIYTTCVSFMGGILMKGLYSANVAYWDNMRSMATDFNNSIRSNATINTILNSQSLIDNEHLQDQFFVDSYSMLISQLDQSIFYNFTYRFNQDTILFAIYLVLLFLLYFILWNKFMEVTRHSLWVTKSMLAIIPLEIIQKVPKIKDFLMASSKTTLNTIND